MTNPADTHGTKTRHFTPVGTVEPALKATKAMVAPAEKIQQVVEELAYFAPSKNDKEIHTLVLEFEDVKTALTAQLDAIIDGEQNRVDDLNWLHRRAELPQLKRDFLLAREEVIGTLARLKEARSSLDSGCTSITNSTHE